MAIDLTKGISLDELSKQQAASAKENDVGFFESALAGLATGLWNIPKGFVSLGAEIYDLAADTDTAKEVEEWFDEVNPFDDEAEARTIGRITQAIAQIAPTAIGGAAIGARIGRAAKAALDAKKSGRFLKLAEVGKKIVGPTSGAIVGGGVGESLVADEEIGTLADLLRGTSLEPYAITMMDRETQEGRSEAYRRLKNRLKFGTEGALFSLALLGAGKGVQQLRKPSETGLVEYANSKLGRALQKFGIAGLKPEGTGTKATFEAFQMSKGNINAVQRTAGELTQEFDKVTKEIFPVIKDQYFITKNGVQETAGAQTRFLDEIYNILRPIEGEKLLKPEAIKRVQLESKDGLLQLKEPQKFFIDDYKTSPQLQKLLDKVKKAGGNSDQLEQVIKNYRLAVDNMSLKLLNRKMPSEVAEPIMENLGSYLNAEYKQFIDLPFIKKYKPTAEQIKKAEDTIIRDKLVQLRKEFGPDYKPTPDKIRQLEYEAGKEVSDFIKKKSLDEVDVVDGNVGKKGANTVKNNNTKLEEEAVAINPSILKPKQLARWQEEVAGIIKDPTYTFYNTVGKQAHLNYTLRYMDEISKIGSKGKNKFIFEADELDETLKNDPLKFKEVKPTGKLTGLSPLEGKFIRSPIYDAIFEVRDNWLNRDSIGAFYKYAILAPKAVSQIAKTILSPITHVRNFISAGAFAAANGAFFPNYGDIKMLAPKFLGGEGLFKQAYDLTGKRILGTMTAADNDLYKRLLRTGVVDSAVQPGETKRLLRDVFSDPYAADKSAMTVLSDGLPKKLAKTYGKIQDAYVGEDDFWKIVTWNLERNRYGNVLQKLGVNKDNYKTILGESTPLGNYLRKSVQRDELVQESFEGFLDEIAGNLVRNNVPNYGYVGRTAKALRASPFGNFIAFPIEIMRTGNNIFSTAIDEITSGIPELVALGYRRLMSFGMTAGGLPIALVEYFKAQNGVTDEEMKALRRFVPEWSKNSTLLPVGRDEDGQLKYVDFSYSNAYDTLTRPFRAIMNEIADGEATNKSLKESLGKGLTESFIELMEPFASESIFTEALIDSTFRRGIGRGGRKVWQDEDDPFIKIMKGVGHISESLKPGSIDQLKRLSNAVTGTADKKYGETFELKDELPGLFGFRSIKVNPEKGLTYMTTRFSKRLDNADNLFTAPLLRGGRVTSEDIINRFQYSQTRRFQVLKEMYQDIDAARKLGLSEAKIRNKVKRKGIAKDVFNELMQGKFTPRKPSEFFEDRMAKINRDLNKKEGVNIPNPYLQSLSKINKIVNDNRRVNLLTEELKMPDFEVPEETINLEQQLQTPIPQTFGLQPLPTAQAPAGNIDQITGLTYDQQFATLFPNDPLGQTIAQRKRV